MDFSKAGDAAVKLFIVLAVVAAIGCAAMIYCLGHFVGWY